MLNPFSTQIPSSASHSTDWFTYYSGNWQHTSCPVLCKGKCSSMQTTESTVPTLRRMAFIPGYSIAPRISGMTSVPNLGINIQELYTRKVNRLLVYIKGMRGIEIPLLLPPPDPNSWDQGPKQNLTLLTPVKIECFHETFSLSTHDPKIMLLTLVFKFFGGALTWGSPVIREDMVEVDRLDVVECGFAQPADLAHSLGSLSA